MHVTRNSIMATAPVYRHHVGALVLVTTYKRDKARCFDSECVSREGLECQVMGHMSHGPALLYVILGDISSDRQLWFV